MTGPDVVPAPDTQAPVPGEDPDQPGPGGDGTGGGSAESGPPPAHTVTRSPDEIVARLRPMRQQFLQFGTEVLLSYLDYDQAHEFLQPHATPELWAEAREDPAQVLDEATKYLEFAFEKALDHRGLSAGRSVQKLTEWAWLMGQDDLADRMSQDENYPQYGVPALQMFARWFGLPIPDNPELDRMGDGLPCEPGCEEGCST